MTKKKEEPSEDEPFFPVTGNPEAKDYLDFYRHLQKEKEKDKKKDT